MKIVVLVKEVPDTYGDRRLNLETGLADRAASEAVTDEIGERTLDVAVSYVEKNVGTEVVVLTAGPETAVTSLRKALAIGADTAVHVLDDELLVADVGLTAEVLAAALKRVSPDLVVAGNQSTDGSGGVIPAMLAELLGLPHATNLAAVEIATDGVTGTRVSDGGSLDVTATLPAIISVTERLPDARFPNFKASWPRRRSRSRHCRSLTWAWTPTTPMRRDRFSSRSPSARPARRTSRSPTRATAASGSPSSSCGTGSRERVRTTLR